MSTAPAPTGRRRPHPLFITLVIVAGLLVLFSFMATVWTDFLWYESLGYRKVFTTRMIATVALFLIGLVLMAGIVIGNGLLAMRLRPEQRSAAPSSLLDSYRQVLFSGRFRSLVIGSGVLLGLFGGLGLSGNADTLLAWMNSTPFEGQDSTFGLNPAFYVFEYPFWRMLLTYLMTALVVSLIASGVIHYLSGALRLERNATSSKQAQIHLSVLIGVILLVFAGLRVFDRFGLQLTPGQLLTGISYTDDHVRSTAQLALVGITVLCALLFFANAIFRRWRIPVVAVALLVVSGLVLSGLSAGVQAFSVNPDEPDKEKPYIENHIAATRKAFDVDHVEITEYDAETEATAGQLRADAEALPGIRLIDPEIVSPAYEQFQQVRGFYQFPDTLDVDRYTIDGEESDVVMAAREIDISGLESQEWANVHTVYTHGYGLVAAYGNRRQAEGEPEWLSKDIPPTGVLADHEPRIYFGQLHTDYSIVGAPDTSPPVELDTPGGGEGTGASQMFTYDGEGGVPIGSYFNRLLYAVRFADANIVLSNRVNEESRIIYDRTPRERVQAAAPWLTVDSNVYPAVADGRLVWIVDGYTTSNSYPNSDRVDLDAAISDSRTPDQGIVPTSRNVNYMRNSVKAVVDAYHGTVDLYAWDEEDPLLQTWDKSFPDLVKDRDEIPEELMDHLRYPSDYFQVQREVLSRYHMSDSHQWYQNTDLWQIPDDPVRGEGSREQPYYLSVKWPGDEDPKFSLTSVYVPNGRSNLAAYMAVNADASDPDYGQLRVLRMSDQTQIDGPGQTFNAMTTNETVAARLRPYLNQGAASASYGNLLTLPVGGGLLYVQPVYTERQGSTGAYPALTFVITRFGQSVGIGSTLQESLDQTFGGDAGATTGEDGTAAEPTDGDPETAQPDPDPDTEEAAATPPEGEEPATDESAAPAPAPTGEIDQAALSAAVADAERAFTEADEALAAGDLGLYQDKTQEANAAMDRVLEAMGG